MPRKPRAVGYIRERMTSTSGPSVEKREAAIRGYCDSQGFELMEILIDNADDGLDELLVRPKGRLLLSVCKDRGAAHIVAFNLYSVFRDVVDAGRTLERWRRKRKKLHLVDFDGEPFIAEGEAWRLFLRIFAVAEKMEKHNLSQRIQAGQLARRVRGFVTGNVPYGYDRIGSRLILNPQEAAVVAKARRLHDKKRMSYNRIAKIFNDESVPTKKNGARWHASTVSNILAPKIISRPATHEESAEFAAIDPDYFHEKDYFVQEPAYPDKNSGWPQGSKK